MIIAHVIDYFQPQLGYQESYLAREQTKLGHDVHIITSDRYFPFPVYHASIQPLLGERVCGTGSSTWDGYHVHRVPTRVEVGGRVWLAGLEKMLTRLQPDVVHVHNVATLTGPRVARIKARGIVPFRLIYDDHMLEVVSLRPSRVLLYALFRLLFADLILEQADAIVAVTEDTKHFMSHWYGIPQERITVIPLGTDTDRFRFDPEARQRIRDQLGIDDDETAFIYAGKLALSKRPDWLVRAALKLLSEGEGIQVIMVGSGAHDYLSNMKVLVTKAGKQDRFHWFDVVPNSDLPAYFSAADVGVWPRESSVAMLEANACGRPVIVSQIGAALERVKWENGVSYREGNLDELADKMRLLHRNPLLRIEMGRAAREAVGTYFSWSRIAKQFLDLVA